MQPAQVPAGPVLARVVMLHRVVLAVVFRMAPGVMLLMERWVLMPGLRVFLGGPVRRQGHGTRLTGAAGAGGLQAAPEVGGPAVKGGGGRGLMAGGERGGKAGLPCSAAIMAGVAG